MAVALPPMSRAEPIAASRIRRMAFPLLRGGTPASARRPSSSTHRGRESVAYALHAASRTFCTTSSGEYPAAQSCWTYRVKLRSCTLTLPSPSPDWPWRARSAIAWPVQALRFETPPGSAAALRVPTPASSTAAATPLPRIYRYTIALLLSRAGLLLGRQVQRLDDAAERQPGRLVHLAHPRRVARLEETEAATLLRQESAAQVAHRRPRCAQSLARGDRRPLRAGQRLHRDAGQASLHHVDRHRASPLCGRAVWPARGHTLRTRPGGAIGEFMHFRRSVARADMGVFVQADDWGAISRDSTQWSHRVGARLIAPAIAACPASGEPVPPGVRGGPH